MTQPQTLVPLAEQIAAVEKQIEKSNGDFWSYFAIRETQPKENTLNAHEKHITALTAARDTLAGLQKRQPGDWFYDENDPETGYANAEDVLSDFSPGEVVELSRCRVMETRFYVCMPSVEWTDEMPIRDFDTAEQAEQAVKKWCEHVPPAAADGGEGA